MTQPANAEPMMPRSIVFVLAAVPLVLFARAAQFPYTNWDDPQAIINNPCLTWSLDNLAAIWKLHGVPHEMLYIPVTYCSYLIDELIAGRAAGWVHAVNVLLHTLNTVFVCLLCCRLRLPRAGIIIATLLFALHPVQVEPVVWATGRKDLLSACFALAAILVYLGSRAASPTVRRRMAVLVLAALAMLAKPSMIILPLLLLLVDSWESGSPTRSQLVSKSELFVLAALILGIHSMMPTDAAHAAPVGVSYRLACLLDVAWGWLGRLAAIAPVCPLYGWPTPERVFRVGAWLPMVMVTVVSVVLLLHYRHRRAFVGLMFAMFALAPAVAIVLGSREFVTADRYAYLAFAGIGLFVGSLCDRRWCIGLCVVWVLVCGVRTIRQIPVWSDSERVWHQVIEQYPQTALAYNNLALTYVEKGQLDAARQTAAAGVRIAPEDVVLITHYGRILLELGEVDAAFAVLQNALELDETNAKARKIIADIHLRRYHDAQAAAQHGISTSALLAAAVNYEKAIAADPAYTDAYIGLGGVYLHEGDPNKAGAVYLKALELRPDDAEIYFNLGIVHSRLGSTKSAVATYEKSVQLSRIPDPTKIYNLAKAYEADGRGREAVATYTQLLQLQPDHAEAMINAARIYQLSGMPDKAMPLYDQALTISTEHNAGIQLNRALLFRQNAKLEEAVAACLAALAADPAMKSAHAELASLYEELAQPDKAAFHQGKAVEQ